MLVVLLLSLLLVTFLFDLFSSSCSSSYSSPKFYFILSGNFGANETVYQFLFARLTATERLGDIAL